MTRTGFGPDTLFHVQFVLPYAVLGEISLGEGVIHYEACKVGLAVPCTDQRTLGLGLALLSTALRNLRISSIFANGAGGSAACAKPHDAMAIQLTHPQDNYLCHSHFNNHSIAVESFPSHMRIQKPGWNFFAVSACSLGLKLRD